MAPPPTPSRLRLTWSLTWPDRPNDFSAKVEGDPDHGSCRCYRWNGGGSQDGKYYWVANRKVTVGSGYADSAQEAAEEAERCLFGE
jgi:hypothetical protein